jgi:hypothetical protein
MDGWTSCQSYMGAPFITRNFVLTTGYKESEYLRGNLVKSLTSRNSLTVMVQIIILYNSAGPSASLSTEAALLPTPHFSLSLPSFSKLMSVGSISCNVDILMASCLSEASDRLRCSDSSCSNGMVANWAPDIFPSRSIRLKLVLGSLSDVRSRLKSVLYSLSSFP